jgi:pimeloyl-ACP methyl ester carboxylesterase
MFLNSPGQWMQEDPNGFDDPNPRRYVKNDPTNAVDPTGTTGIFFDGAGQWNGNKGETIINRLQQAFDHRANGQVGPRLQYYTPLLRESWLEKFGIKDDVAPGLMPIKQVEEAYNDVVGAWDRNSREPVYIFGWSRGAAMAAKLAEMLNSHKPPIKVQFLVMIDPVLTDIGFSVDIAQRESYSWIFDRPKPVVYLTANVETAVLVTKYTRLEQSLNGTVKNDLSDFDDLSIFAHHEYAPKPGSSTRLLRMRYNVPHRDIGFPNAARGAVLDFILECARLNRVPGF